MIFYGACDRLALKTSSYVEPYEYVEAYDGMYSVMVCIYVKFGQGCLYNIFWRSLQAGLNRIP